MRTFRAYLNKAKGNDHARVVDLEAADEDDFRAQLDAEVKKSEVVGDVVELADMTTGPNWSTSRDEALEAFAQSVSRELADKMGLDPADTLELARASVRRVGL